MLEQKIDWKGKKPAPDTDHILNCKRLCSWADDCEGISYNDESCKLISNITGVKDKIGMTSCKS